MRKRGGVDGISAQPGVTAVLENRPKILGHHARIAVKCIPARPTDIETP
jgi:hypothetical protein